MPPAIADGLWERRKERWYLLVQVRQFGNPARLMREMFYGWWLAGVAAFVMGICMVPVFQGMTAWFVVLRQQFSWTPGQMSWAFALTKVEGSLMGPVEGFLVDRLGPRRMVFIGMLVLGSGFLLFSQIRELWQLYGTFVILSLGIGLSTLLPVLTLMNSWFIRQRSTAMAVAMEGYIISGILLVPALAWAIDPDADRIGWRATAAGLGILIILLSFPISLLVRNRPEDVGLRPDGDPARSTPAEDQATQASQATEEEVEYTWREALRTRTFWLITFAHASSTVVTQLLAVHLGLMLTDRGLSLQTVGWVVSVFIGVGAVFNMIGGFVGDRIPIRLATFGFSALQSVAIILLVFTHGTAMVFLFAVILGIGWGGRSPLTMAIRGAYFGRKAFASILGISMLPMNVLLFAAPIFAGYMFDYTGSYSIPFTTVGVITLLGCFLFLLLGEPAPLASSGKTQGRGEI